MSPGLSQYFDTASLYFRAFYGLPTSLRAADGRPMNAVRGLLDFLAHFIDTYAPEQVACCWDASWRPEWRVALVPSYKAHRVAVPATAEQRAAGVADVEDSPAELDHQVPMILDVLDALGIAVIGAEGYEADDVLATLTARASGPVDVVTGDRDLFQLVDDEASHRVLYVARGVRKHEQVTDAWLAAKYGIVGRQYVDFAVLRGDASDGLPGVKGIGEKTAASLLARYGDLDGIVAHHHDLGPSIARALASTIDYIGAARQVVACAADVALPRVDLTRPRAPRDPARFARLADDLNLGGSAERMLAALARQPGDARA